MTHPADRPAHTTNTTDSTNSTNSTNGVNDTNGSNTADGTNATTNRAATAVLFTADRFLAAQVSELHPAVTLMPAAADPRLTGLPDTDGVLRLTDPTGTRTLYLGVDLDDAQVWSRAVDVGAHHVVVLPDGRFWLWGHLAAHLGTPTPG